MSDYDDYLANNDKWFFVEPVNYDDFIWFDEEEGPFDTKDIKVTVTWRKIEGGCQA